MTMQELLDIIYSKHVQGKTALIGIDGCGGAGKTTLAERLKKLDPSIQIVHMDEFDLPFKERLKLPPEKKSIGGDSDWQRLLKEVLEPLKENRTALFQIYNWDTDRIDSKKTIQPGGIVIVEGVYAIREELSEFYTLKIWIDVPKEIRVKRGLARDGEEARSRWFDDWIPMEDRYVAVQKPHELADIVLKG